MRSQDEHPHHKFRKHNLKAWEDILSSIFPEEIPKSASWNDRNEIVNILRILGSKLNLNHTFFPTCGGLDLTGAAVSTEDDCIELHFESHAVILKPASLYFESFDAELEWAYFRIDTRTLAPSGVNDNIVGTREELLEINRGDYLDRGIFDQGFLAYDESGREIAIPETARLVTRFFSGSFVIFAKGSIYNSNSATYDARHNKMSAPNFRKHIQEVIDYLKKK